MIEKTEKVIMLKDFYGPLLTAKQQEALSLYYENDWSLAEIAENMGISRQGVYDLLKRAEHSLEGYEDKLCLVQRFSATKRQLERVVDILTKSAADQQFAREVLLILKEIENTI